MTSGDVLEPLETLAREVNEAHRETIDHAEQALAHAVRAGRLLTDAKAQVPRGEWLAWLSSHTSISERNAQRYMQLARADPTALSGGIEAALRALAQPRERPEQPRDQAQLGAALREAGATSLDPADLARLQRAEPAFEPDEPPRFPANGMQRRTWRDLHGLIEAMQRHMRSATSRHLVPWARGESLREATKVAGEIRETLDLLAQDVDPR